MKEPLAALATLRESFATICVLEKPAEMMNMQAIMMVLELEKPESAVLMSMQPVMTSSIIESSAESAMEIFPQRKLAMVKTKMTRQIIIWTFMLFPSFLFPVCSFAQNQAKKSLLYALVL